MSSATLTYGSLFSGIGGFDLGFGLAGMQCLWQVENDAKASAVLARHWPDVERFEDVRNVGRDNLRPVDVVCGGFPCQDVSVAGNRAGLAGERSGLWFEFHRILDELRPAWVVIENVPGLLSSNGGRDFATILRGLVELRYGVTWRVLDSQYFGVAQRRRRVFIVGSLGNGRSAEVLFEREGLFGSPPARQEQREGVTYGIAPSLTASDAGVERTGERRGQDPLVVGALQANDKVNNQHVNRNKLVVFQQNQRNEVRDLGDVTGALQAQPGMKQQNYLAYSVKTAQTGSNGWGVGEEVMGTLDGANGFAVAMPLRAGRQYSDTGDGQANIVAQPLRSNVYNNSDPGLDAAMQIYSVSGVRRLTPTECERLQAFSDGWTAGQPDTARYKQLGNAVTVSVAEWIGKRIMQLRKESTDDIQLA